MITKLFKVRTIYLLFAAFVFSGCAGTPERLPILEQAQSTYAAAQADPHVAQYAPVELRRAGESLRQAQRLQEEGADPTLISHHAYLAKQRTETAREFAQAAMAQQVIDSASRERNQILLQARERQAQLARERATGIEQRAEKATESAAEAKARAQELEQQLAELKAKRTTRGIVLTLPDVLFDVGEATLKPGAYRAIDRLAEVMKQNPEITIRADGFTDSTGSEELNQALSENRADAVRTALIDRGIEANRIVSRGLGESLPIATNQTIAGRQQNRRVEVVVLNAPRGGSASTQQ